MAWTAPSTFVAGAVLTAAQMNVHVRDNPNALRTGGIAIASQAANDLIYASSATQLARLAASGPPDYVLASVGAGSAPVLVPMVRTWVAVSGGATTVPVIDDSRNVASVVWNGTGDWTVNLTNPVGSTTYAVIITPRTCTLHRSPSSYAHTSSSFSLFMYDAVTEGDPATTGHRAGTNWSAVLIGD